MVRDDVDVNVKNVPGDVAARLAEQAAAEGMSQQEWIRRILQRTADRPSPAELVRQRATVSPMSDAEFEAIRAKVRARHAG